ncbi:hypothetical protein HAX54_021760, partial [Datura stramonium]|nr:hypothetical protein [Datura stramonium]
TSYGESRKIKVLGHVVRFTAMSFNAFLGKLVVDLEMYFLLLEKRPYNEICHIFCGEHSAAHCTRSENGTHLTLSFSYLTKKAREQT